MKEIRKLMDKLVARPGKKISLKDYDPDWTGSIKDKEQASTYLAEGVKQLSQLQDKLYAQDTYALLMIFQAMDAAGKDGTIRHVMSGINPQGCQVFSFKAPSAEERDHDYLWRSVKALPERGRIGIHNRSYYEEVLVCRVHPEIFASQQLPDNCRTDEIWKRRFKEINAFERYLVDNGVVVLKFYLNVSKKEQKRRFLERIDMDDKNWKFSVNDARERAFWKDYMRAYEDVFTHTSTKSAPWFIIPADNKWFMRYAVSAITVQTLDDLKLKYPTLTKAKKKELLEARKMLTSEKS
ncbi:MAG TPA: polyphosphate kinase 2 family protein [Vicinamibacterales bacterium]|jgi:PPK2 family polyphosphate:nucleotide phosphotransferase